MLEPQAELEEYLGRTFDQVPVAMILVDQQGSIARINRLAESTFGYTNEELTGRPIEVLMPERYRESHPTHRKGFTREASARPMGAGRDLSGLRRDGSEFPVEIALTPVHTSKGSMVLSVIVDLTERKLAEKRIQEALLQKDLLLREVHHRVKNNLQVIHSLLDLQSLQSQDPTLVAQLRESQNRIRSMALIHQTLYQSQNLARVDFQHFLGELLPRLTEAYSTVSGCNVAMEIDAHGVALPIHEAIPCGLIVNELVSNALKHAFTGQAAGRIDVSMRALSDGEAELTVSDDGCGIPAHLDFSRTGSLGVQLVSLLSRQLRGNLTIERSKPTRFTLRFPISHQAP